MMNQNILKTWNYMKRNGVKKAVGAAYERLTAHYDTGYEYKAPPAEELVRQREFPFLHRPLISILVPAYETETAFLSALLDSVMGQTYNNWELIIADASQGKQVEDCVAEWKAAYEEKQLKAGNPQESIKINHDLTDYNNIEKIKYHKLLKNEGISANSNQAISFATGDYIGLLDHDDLLTPDALFEMVKAIHAGVEKGKAPRLLYSDEDKCDKSGVCYYKQNIKTGFNFDFLLSNNYICHFLVMEASLMRSLGFRPVYDGAQDYDLILRAAGRIEEEEIVHVGRVLYHWRCHETSTSANPASKLYAYEAGREAVTDFLKMKGIPGTAEHTEHMGFYKIRYDRDILEARADVGMTGGSVINRDNKIESGILLRDGRCPFQGLPAFFSGPANVASVCRDAFALDARTVFLREGDIPLFEEILKIPYKEKLKERDTAYCNQLDEGIWRQRSMELSEKIRARGQRLLWNPEIRVKR